MKAVLSMEKGPADSLVVADLPEPVAGPGEVVVDVAAVGLNFFDTLIIEDRYQHKPPRPFSPGGEFAGAVRALGEGVSDFSVADRVCGNVRSGAARERLVVPVGRLARVPDGVPLTKAAAVLISYGTTLHALRDRGELKSGETLVVLGASGGVGLAAVEIGKAMGARVIACASSAEKLALAARHGADELVDYATEDLRGRLRQLTGGKGVDVVYDPVGGDFAEPVVRSLAWLGRYLVIGFAAGDIPRIPLNLLLLKGCDLRGVTLGGALEHDPGLLRRHADEILALLAQGAIAAHVSATYPLEDCAKAIADIAGRKAQGKIVLLTEVGVSAR
ncbi:NADPH:quinone oxidoreductase family protein [Bosea sp. 117]|uniref:NADPH:quinone oxidoreductase family protein n=1 Tax=Bosea sp. 117 TaxID=1125973 RepID=UPI0004940902|nr:NADPH:quinone oxidoreductase family protein [Bosea sp. 117]